MAGESPAVRLLRDQRLWGQHPLLGFHLGSEVLGLAARLGVEIDVDEYGDEYE